MANAGFRHRVPGSLAEERASVQLALANSLATSLLQSQPTEGIDLPVNQANFPSPFHQHGAQHDAERAQFTSHIEPLEALLDDCSVLKTLSRRASSFRERCRELGAVADEIKLAARNAAKKVSSEDASILLSRILASCHKEVYLAQTRIEVHGMYSKVKKYVKILAKRHITLKFREAHRRLCTWLNQLWSFIRENTPAEFRVKYAELERIDDGTTMNAQNSAPSMPSRRPHSTTDLNRRSVGRSLGSFTGSVVEASHPTSSITDQINLAAGVGVDGSVCSEPAASIVPVEGGPVSGAGGSRGERLLMSTTNSRHMASFFRGKPGSRGAAGARRTTRKLAVAHVMAKPVTALLYVDSNIADSSNDDAGHNGGGFVWWWTKGGNMHVHDVQSNNTSTKLFPLDTRSNVRVLALDMSHVWVWAGHEDGMLSVWREATNKLACYTDRPLAKELGSVTSIEPVGRLTVAVGVESGRVVVVKLDDCPVDASARTGDGSPVSAANSDGRKRIVAVAELRSTTTKGQVPDDFGASPAACALPPAVAKRSMLNTALRRFADAFKLPSMPKGPADEQLIEQASRVSVHADRPHADVMMTLPHDDDTSRMSLDSFAAIPDSELSLPTPSLKPPLAPRSGSASRRARSFQSPRPPASPGGAAAASASLSPPEAMSKEASASQEVTPLATTPRRRERPSDASRPSGASSSQPPPDGPPLPDGPERSTRPSTSLPKAGSSLPMEDSGVLQKFVRGARQIRTMATVALADSMIPHDADGLMERAHDNRIEAMLAREPYLFTAAAASGVCDAQIRIWVQSRDQEVKEYGLHDTFHCTVNRAARCMCVIPWDDDKASVADRPIAEDAAAASTHSVDRNWRLLTAHDSGNILLFDPRMPHLKPILTIQFQSFSNVTPRRISVLPQVGLLAVTRADGTVQLLSMITNRSRIMKSAIDPTKKSEVMDGVVELQQAGCVLRLHDKRIDHVSVSGVMGDMATATVRGNVSFWSRRLFDEKATEAGLMKGESTRDQLARDEVAPMYDSGHGEALFRVTKQENSINSSTVLEDQDLDIVDYKDVTLQRHLGNGAFGTVREAMLHHTPVAVKILKEGEVGGALGSLAMAHGDKDLQDIRKNLVREVRILKGIRHPNVLFFRGICLQPPMIITELCDHGSVSDIIALYNRMTAPNPTILVSPEKQRLYEEHMAWPGRVRLALDAAKGMLYLHSKDLLHCDLKSLNLLVDKSWMCKVADFGLSRYLSGKQGSRNVPAVNNPMWQAPEVIADSGRCSKQGDVYSFGVVMWELLMMSRPWVGVPLPLISQYVQGGSRPEVPQSLADVPGSRSREVLPAVHEYTDLMARCWHQSHDTRPNFEEVVGALEAIDNAVTSHEEKQKRKNQAMLSFNATEATAWQRSSGRSSWQSSNSRRGSLPQPGSNASSGNMSPLSPTRTPDPAAAASITSRQPAIELDVPHVDPFGITPDPFGAVNSSLRTGYTDSHSQSRTLSHQATSSLPHSHSLPHVQPSLGVPRRPFARSPALVVKASVELGAPHADGAREAMHVDGSPSLPHHGGARGAYGSTHHLPRNDSSSSRGGALRPSSSSPAHRQSSRSSLGPHAVAAQHAHNDGAVPPLGHSFAAAQHAHHDGAVPPLGHSFAAAQHAHEHGAVPPLGHSFAAAQQSAGFEALPHASSTLCSGLGLSQSQPPHHFSHESAGLVQMPAPTMPPLGYIPPVRGGSGGSSQPPTEKLSADTLRLSTHSDALRAADIHDAPSRRRRASGAADRSSEDSEANPDGQSFDRGAPTARHGATTDTSDVHITIGNEIEERMFGTGHSTLSGSGAHRGRFATTRGRELEDTFGVVLPGQSGLLDVSQRGSSAEDGAQGTVSSGAAAAAAAILASASTRPRVSSAGAPSADGMFHTSMDSAAIAALPMMDAGAEPRTLREVAAARRAAAGSGAVSSASANSAASPRLPVPVEESGGSPLRTQPLLREPSGGALRGSPFDSATLPNVAALNALPGMPRQPTSAFEMGPSSTGSNTLRARAGSGALRRPQSISRTESAPGSRFMSSPFDDGPTSSRQASVALEPPPAPAPAEPPFHAARTYSAFDVEPHAVRDASASGAARAPPLTQLLVPPTRQLADSTSVNSSQQRLSEMGSGGGGGVAVHAASFPGMLTARDAAGPTYVAAAGGLCQSPLDPVGLAHRAMHAAPAGPSEFDDIMPPLRSSFDTEPSAARGSRPVHRFASRTETAASTAPSGAAPPRLPSTFDVEPAPAASTASLHSALSNTPFARPARVPSTNARGSGPSGSASAPSRSASAVARAGPQTPHLASPFDPPVTAPSPWATAAAPIAGPHLPNLASSFDPPGGGTAGGGTPAARATAAGPQLPNLISSFDAPPSRAPPSRTTSAVVRASGPQLPHLVSSFDGPPSAAPVSGAASAALRAAPQLPQLTSSFDAPPSSMPSARTTSAASRSGPQLPQLASSFDAPPSSLPPSRTVSAASRGGPQLASSFDAPPSAMPPSRTVAAASRVGPQLPQLASSFDAPPSTLPPSRTVSGASRAGPQLPQLVSSFDPPPVAAPPSRSISAAPRSGQVASPRAQPARSISAVTQRGAAGQVSSPRHGSQFDAPSFAASSTMPPRGPSGAVRMASSGSRQLRSTTLGEPPVRGPRSGAAQPYGRTHSGGDRPARQSVPAAPLLASSFDAEPGAAAAEPTQAARHTFVSHPMQSGAGNRAHGPQAARLESGFDAEPPAARLSTVLSAGSDTPLPAPLEPVAEGSRLEPQAPRLTSHFDVEPVSARVYSIPRKASTDGGTAVPVCSAADAACRTGNATQVLHSLLLHSAEGTNRSSADVDSQRISMAPSPPTPPTPSRLPRSSRARSSEPPSEHSPSRSPSPSPRPLPLSSSLPLHPPPRTPSSGSPSPPQSARHPQPPNLRSPVLPQRGAGALSASTSYGSSPSSARRPSSNGEPAALRGAYARCGAAVAVHAQPAPDNVPYDSVELPCVGAQLQARLLPAGGGGKGTPQAQQEAAREG